jgi:hypothetical protein
MSKELTAKELLYIGENYQKTSVPQMSKHLHRDARKVYEYLDKKGWPSYNPNKFGVKRQAKDPGFFNEADYRKNAII